MNNNKVIELYSGPFGSGRTTHLVNKMKELNPDSTDCKFITADSFVDPMREDHGITAFPFEYAEHIGKIGFVFIDNVEIFVQYKGLQCLDDIIDNCNEVYLSATNSDFYYHYRDRNRNTDIEVGVLKFLETIPGVVINKLLLKNNKFLPESYAKYITEEFGYKE